MNTPNAWPRHLLSLRNLPRERVIDLLDSADAMLGLLKSVGKQDESQKGRKTGRQSASPPTGKYKALEGRIVANLFFEDSTRTRSSFTVAVLRLGGQTLEFTGDRSSISKGETLLDTALNIERMGVDCFVVRAAASGAAHLIASRVSCPVINAGDGANEHPTQALLDAMTLRHRIGDLEGRTIGIVGDITHSRVARSNVHVLTTLGATVQLIAPPTLVSRSMKQITQADSQVEIHNDFDSVLESLDAVIMLRVQFERGAGVSRDYRDMYGLTLRRAARLRPDCVILHPGPMNRGLEIDSEVADGDPRSAILEQVTLGVAIRMAVLAGLDFPR